MKTSDPIQKVFHRNRRRDLTKDALDGSCESIWDRVETGRHPRSLGSGTRSVADPGFGRDGRAHVEGGTCLCRQFNASKYSYR